jgi:hypothetical protein
MEFDVIDDQIALAKTVKTPFVELVNGAPHDLHVLLRHRLLQQPGGFEGPLAIPKRLHASHLSITQGEDRRGGLLQLDPIPPAKVLHVERQHPIIVKGANLLGYRAVLGPRFIKRSEDLPYGLPATGNTWCRLFGRLLEDSVTGKKAGESWLNARLVEGVEEGCSNSIPSRPRK